jgi:predicted HicB family RNase H-like nuclease
MSNGELSEQIMVRVTPECLADLQAAAARQERTVAQTVRLAIRLYLDAGQKGDHAS